MFFNKTSRSLVRSSSRGECGTLLEALCSVSPAVIRDNALGDFVVTATVACETKYLGAGDLFVLTERLASLEPDEDGTEIGVARACCTINGVLSSRVMMTAAGKKTTRVRMTGIYDLKERDEKECEEGWMLREAPRAEVVR